MLISLLSQDAEPLPLSRAVVMDLATSSIS